VVTGAVHLTDEVAYCRWGDERPLCRFLHHVPLTDDPELVTCLACRHKLAKPEVARAREATMRAMRAIYDEAMAERHPPPDQQVSRTRPVAEEVAALQLARRNAPSAPVTRQPMLAGPELAALEILALVVAVLSALVVTIG
jgi:hypothetical protein